MEMENPIGFDQGEAYQYRDDDDNANIDPDVALSYIGERLQNLLGHFQKDFEAGVSAENLGAKFGGYGSFLPTYERSPLIRSHPKTPQRNYSAPRSPDNLPLEGATQSCTAPSNVPPSATLGIASCSTQLLRSSREPSVEVSVKQDSCSSSARVVEKFSLKHATLTNPSDLPDRSKLKVRIKVGSNTMRKNDAIYSGLGLDTSPSSSSDSSPKESGDIPPEYREFSDESPISILQSMTSFSVHGGSLISPLHNSLLCLISKEKLLGDGKPLPALEDCQEYSDLSVDGSASRMGGVKVFKGKKTRLVLKSERLVENKHGNGMDLETDSSSLSKKKIDIETPEGKDFLSNDMKLTPLSNSICDGGGPMIGTGWANEISQEANKDGVICKLSSSDLSKEESLESVSGHDSGKGEKLNAKSRSVEKFRGCRVPNTHKDISVNPRDIGRCKSNTRPAPLKADSDISKCKEDLNVGTMNPSKQKVGQEDISGRQVDIEMSSRREKASFEGKRKSTDFKSYGKLAGDFAEESLRVGPCATPKDNKSSGCKIKTHKLKTQKDIGSDKDNCEQLLGATYLKHTGKQKNPVERHSSNRPKDSNLTFVDKEPNASFEKSKERVSCKEVPNAGPPAENRPTSGMMPEAVPSVLIEEDWVLCERCDKWRLLPFGLKPEHLPDKWLCSMLYWLPGMNRCDISEDETTKALQALYQIPGPDSQGNPLNNSTGTAMEVPLSDVRHRDKNHQNVSSHGMLNQVKKKLKTKDILNADSSRGLIRIINSTKNNQEAARSGRLNDMDQTPSESSLKWKHSNDAKERKANGKREADQYGSVASKKTKTEGVDCTDKDQSSEQGVDFGMGRLSSATCLSAKENGRSMLNYNDNCHESIKSAPMGKLLVSVKKFGGQAYVSSGVSSELKTCHKKDISVKKRKSKDWEDNQNHSETFKTTGHHLPDSKVLMKESIESEIRKEKKSRVSKTEEKESSTSRGSDISNKKGRVPRIILSRSSHRPTNGMKGLQGIVKDQKLGKHRGKVEPSQTADDVDPLKRHLGSGHVSLAATSSSSKVSGSCKSKANFQEVKGSPVESVSSSPFRISNPDKLTPAGEASQKDGTTNGLSVMGDPRRCLGREFNAESNRSGTVRKEKVYSALRPQSVEFPTQDYLDGDAKHKFEGKANPSSKSGINHFAISDAVTTEQHGRCPSDLQATEHSSKDKVNKNNFHDNALFPQKPHRAMSSRSKEKDRSSTSDFDRDKMKVTDPLSEQEEMYAKKSLRYESESESQQFAPCHETSVKHSLPDKCSIKSSKDGKRYVSKKESLAKSSSDSRKENQLKFGEQGGSDVKLGTPCSTNGKLTPSDFEGEKFSNKLADKIDPIQMESGGGKLQLTMHHDATNETLANGTRPVPGPQKGVCNILPDNVSGHAVIKASNQPGNENGAYQKLEHYKLNHQGARDSGALSSVKKDSPNLTATNTLKEANVLKDYADNLKISGFGFESNESYFQAALKFLLAASLFETCNSDNGKHGEMNQMQIYSTTAKLCESCAFEYENRQEMTAAALAYKCMEVAYMRVVYYRSFTISKDRHELQATLQTGSQGESPSSSASDVDNLNNQATVNKAALSKGCGSHVAGHHVVVARNRPDFIRLLDFTQDMNLAMEASRKSQNAFAAANVMLTEAENREGLNSVKRVIDFSFQDVEGLVRLVRLAMEAMSHSALRGSRG